MKFHWFLIGCSIVLIGLLGIFCVDAWKYYTIIHADDPIEPNLVVMEGEAKIIRGDYAIELSQNETYTLEEDDAVETLPNSLATVNWPDRSTTRMGASTRIVIHTMLAEKGYENIRISFSLKKGRIWSNIIRSLIGDSYFETRLPKNDIVAGVRGTVMEINLEDRYIHAVSHAISLHDNSGKGLALMPGEIVDSENIWMKKGREILDVTWGKLNETYDTLYMTQRKISTNLSLANDASYIKKQYDRLVRWILQHFRAFEILQLDDLMKDGKKKILSNYSEKSLVEYYQRIQRISTPELRDIVRGALYEKSQSPGSQMNDIFQMIQEGALWDSFDSNTLLPESKKILNAGSAKFSEEMTDFAQFLKEKNLTDEVQNTIGEWINR